jgi:hypothetical protein
VAHVGVQVDLRRGDVLVAEPDGYDGDVVAGQEERIAAVCRSVRAVTRLAVIEGQCWPAWQAGFGLVRLGLLIPDPSPAGPALQASGYLLRGHIFAHQSRKGVVTT